MEKEKDEAPFRMTFCKVLYKMQKQSRGKAIAKHRQSKNEATAKAQQKQKQRVSKSKAKAKYN